MYFDTRGRLSSMPVSWPSLGYTDLFSQASAGRSWWRPDDLLRLVALIAELRRRDMP